MKNLCYAGVMAVILFTTTIALAQGPPILGDKAIMLGAKRTIIKTLNEVRFSSIGIFSKSYLMGHYLPTSNTLFAIHLPFISYNFKNKNTEQFDLNSGQDLGDIQFLGKYQFYRKDNIGKTFRIVVKTIQTLPTGKRIGIERISTGLYQSYFGIVAGYESLKYGFSNELGYNFVPDGMFDVLRHKLSFGLPLLKATYPVNQINLFFEYDNSWYTQNNDFQILYSQGIQYAKGRFTVEIAIQFPLIQSISEAKERDYSLFFGIRYIF